MNEAWKIERYRGEIDVDHLLGMWILREGLPEVFRLVVEFAPAFRELNHEEDWEQSILASEVPDTTPEGHPITNPGLDSAMLRVVSFVHAIEQNIVDAKTRAAVLGIVRFVFVENRQNFPQGFGSGRGLGEAYWHIFLTEPHIKEEERDQPRYREAIGADDTQLLDLLENQLGERYVLDVAPLLSQNRLRGLLPKLITRHGKDRPETWNSWQTPGLVALARVWCHRRQNDWDPIEALRTLQEVICYAMATCPTIVPQLLSVDFKNAVNTDGSHFEPLKKCVRDSFIDCFAGKPDKLIQIFSGTHNNLLRDLFANGIGEMLRSVQDRPQWDPMIETFSTAIRQAASVMLPQLAHLLMNVSDRDFIMKSSDFKYILGSEDTARKLLEELPSESWSDDPAEQALLMHILSDPLLGNK